MIYRDKEATLNYINNLTSSYIYAKYPLDKQLENKSRLIELSMLDSENADIGKLQNKLNWISAILDIGRAAKVAVNLSNNLEQIQNIKEDYNQLLKTL
jgi:hypothetical protein